MKRYKINNRVVDAKSIEEAIVKASSIDFDYLLKEEEKAVQDYKAAIAQTNDSDALYVLSHILKEEAHHIELLKKLQQGEVHFEDCEVE